MTAGKHELVWGRNDDRGTAVPAGVYFAELRAGNGEAKTKFVVLK
jgi:hypothetical protein